MRLTIVERYSSMVATVHEITPLPGDKADQMLQG